MAGYQTSSQTSICDGLSGKEALTLFFHMKPTFGRYFSLSGSLYVVYQLEIALKLHLMIYLFIWIHNTTTAGHRWSTVNSFSRVWSPDGSPTDLIWFPTSKYSIEIEAFEFSFIPNSNLLPSLSCLSFVMFSYAMASSFMSRAFPLCQGCQSKGGLDTSRNHASACA